LIDHFGFANLGAREIFSDEPDAFRDGFGNSLRGFMTSGRAEIAMPVEAGFVHRHIFDVAAVAPDLLEHALQRARLHIGFGIRPAAIRPDDQAGAYRKRDMRVFQIVGRELQIGIRHPFEIGEGRTS
jgi:hypothetical protein